MSDSLIPSFLVSNVSESLRSLTKNERCERIAQVAHQKWAPFAFSSFFSFFMTKDYHVLRIITNFPHFQAPCWLKPRTRNARKKPRGRKDDFSTYVTVPGQRHHCAQILRLRWVRSESQPATKKISRHQGFGGFFVLV